MNSGKKKRSNLSDDVPDWGPGILMDNRSLGSVKRVRSALKILSAQEYKQFDKFTISDKEEKIFEAVDKIVMRYWWDYDRDNRTTDADLKKELSPVAANLKPLLSALAKIPKESRGVINRRIYGSRALDRPVFDYFAEMERISDQIMTQCEAVITRKFSKNASTCVRGAKNRIVNLWEKTLGQRFAINKVLREPRPDSNFFNGQKEFAGDGMHFLHVTLNAIDPQITHSQVLSCFQKSGAPRKADETEPPAHR